MEKIRILLKELGFVCLITLDVLCSLFKKGDNSELSKKLSNVAKGGRVGIIELIKIAISVNERYRKFRISKKVKEDANVKDIVNKLSNLQEELYVKKTELLKKNIKSGSFDNDDDVNEFK